MGCLQNLLLSVYTFYKLLNLFALFLLFTDMAEPPNQPSPNQQQVSERVFIPKHIQVAILDENLHGIDDYQQIISEIRDRAILRFGYSGNLGYRQYHKGMLHEKWRFFFHIIMQCLAPRKLGFDDMSHNLLLAMIGLTFNQPYNFTQMILKALKSKLNYVAGDPHLLMLYSRFLMIIFRHLVSDLPINDGLPKLVLQRMTRRIFVDCRNVKAFVRSPRLPEIRPMLVAIVVDDYNLATDAVWNEIFVGINQLCGIDEDDDDATNVLLQYRGTSVDVIIEVIPNILVDQSTLSAENILLDSLLAMIDATLGSDAPSSSVSKGKGLLVEEEDAFQDKVDSLGPSSEWASRLSFWKEKSSDLENLPDDSSDDDDGGDSDDRPSGALASSIVTYKRRRLGEIYSSAQTYSALVDVSALEVSAPVHTSVFGRDVAFKGSRGARPPELSLSSVISSAEVHVVVSVSGFYSLSSGTPLFSLGVSTAPLFSTFPSFTGSCNLFATSVGLSSSTVPLDVTTLPPGTSSGTIRPRGACPDSP
ncbi:hypothetical protein Hanom_Chr09g00799921 [Helianthus anomalus]